MCACLSSWRVRVRVRGSGVDGKWEQRGASRVWNTCSFRFVVDISNLVLAGSSRVSDCQEVHKCEEARDHGRKQRRPSRCCVLQPGVLCVCVCCVWVGGGKGTFLFNIARCLLSLFIFMLTCHHCLPNRSVATRPLWRCHCPSWCHGHAPLSQVYHWFVAS